MRRSCTRLSSALPKATPGVLLQCKLGPVNVWQGCLPPGNTAVIENRRRGVRRRERPTINRSQPPKDESVDLLGRVSRR
ncbi:hypothetical protein MUK42_36652 [Musa troglodytarum]|uniref:Uncharacterized protein n=1 Tax=Musa troglodytarum TaxID=320322 RepID=A0A9E7JCI6_9LILI|nr:hypothetical protein MUK42_36652 [Musa troglodytarum]